MALGIGDNFSYQGKKPNFERDSFKTKAEMKAFPESNVDEGHISFCEEDGKHYVYKAGNSIDATTGKWSVFKTEVNLSEYAKKTDVEQSVANKADKSYVDGEVTKVRESKQDALVDGITIKTINGQSVLGKGNITVTGPDGQLDLSGYATKVDVNNYVTEYNVSKHHPTSGIGGTNKFTLAEAIKLIPQELQSEGIKCSFLDENNLIHTFVYQGGNDFLTPTNWTSIDGVDTTALDKLNSDLEELTKKVCGYSGGFKELTGVCFNNGKFIFQDGTISSNSAFCYSEPIPLKRGDKIKVVTEDGRSDWAFYYQLSKVTTINVSYVPIVKKNSASDPISFEHTIEEDGNYAICGMIGYTKIYTYQDSVTIYGANSAIGTSYDDSISNIGAKNVQNAIESVYLNVKGNVAYIDKSELRFNNGKFIFDNGTISSNSAFCYSEPIPLKRGDKIKVVTEDGKSTFNQYFQLAKVITNGVKYTPIVIKNSITSPISFDYIIEEDSDYAICGMIGYTKIAIFDAGKTIYGANSAIGTSYDDLKVKIGVNNVQDAIDLLSNKAYMGRRFSPCKAFGTQPAANGIDFRFDPRKDGYNELINNIYEPIRLSNDKYINRTNIGKDESGTIDMYVYEFIPKYYQQHILLIAGVHGDEVDGVICLARIMQIIASSNSENDEDIIFLRNNVRITVLPALNVWGITQHPNVRTNSARLEMQSWNDSREPKEVTNLIAYLNQIYKTISFGLSMHTTTTDTYKDFYGVIHKHAKNVRTIYRVVDWLCRKYAKHNASVDDQILGYLNWKNGDNMEIDYWMVHYGFAGSIMELSDYRWGNPHSKEAITMGVTMWMNYIIQQVNDFYPPQKSIIDIPSGDYRESQA